MATLVYFILCWCSFRTYLINLARAFLCPLCSNHLIITLASRSGNLASSEMDQMFFTCLLNLRQIPHCFFVSALSWNIMQPSGKKNNMVPEQLVNGNGQINIGSHPVIRWDKEEMLKPKETTPNDTFHTLIPPLISAWKHSYHSCWRRGNLAIYGWTCFIDTTWIRYTLPTYLQDSIHNICGQAAIQALTRPNDVIIQCSSTCKGGLHEQSGNPVEDLHPSTIPHY